MTPSLKLRSATCAIVFGLASLNTACAQDFHLKIIALNDFHGNLQSPGKMAANAQSPQVPVGGIDYMAAYVAHLKSQNPDNIVVSAGDLTGGSPLLSALFHEEPTIETMNRLGLELNAVGNHEFDKGMQELLRLQNGGCSHLDRNKPDQNTCLGKLVGTPVPFEGAKFKYLAANVIDTSTGKTIFPGYAIKMYHGVKVAFIGVVMRETPTIVVRSNIAGLRFTDEATAINAIVRRLRRQGVESFVVLIHQGGRQTTQGTPDINACAGDLNGTPIQPIVNKLDNAVDLVISAHTHLAYICQVPNRAGRKITVTSASSYSRMLTDIDLTIDPHTRKVTAVTARNLLVDRTNPDIAPDPAIQSIVSQYAALAAPLLNRVVGSVAGDITKPTTPSGESAIGELVADAQLEATSAPNSGAAVIAFINESGVRTGLAFASTTPGIADGKVTYGELYEAQPFANTLVTMTLTGAQIANLLEEQFKGCALDAPPGAEAPTGNRMLEPSDGFTYTWSRAAAPCHKVDPSSIKLHGVTVTPSARYRVTVNNFLADGGEQFYMLKQGTNRLTGPVDLDATTAYFAKHPSIAPIPPHRITAIP